MSRELSMPLGRFRATNHSPARLLSGSTARKRQGGRTNADPTCLTALTRNDERSADEGSTPRTPDRRSSPVSAPMRASSPSPSTTRGEPRPPRTVRRPSTPLAPAVRSRRRAACPWCAIAPAMRLRRRHPNSAADHSRATSRPGRRARRGSRPGAGCVQLGDQHDAPRHARVAVQTDNVEGLAVRLAARCAWAGLHPGIVGTDETRQ